MSGIPSKKKLRGDGNEKGTWKKRAIHTCFFYLPQNGVI
jgi:hypothetical protein